METPFDELLMSKTTTGLQVIHTYNSKRRFTTTTASDSHILFLLTFFPFFTFLDLRCTNATSRKILNLTSYGGRDQTKRFFSELRYSPQTSNHVKLTTFDKWTQLNNSDDVLKRTNLLFKRRFCHCRRRGCLSPLNNMADFGELRSLLTLHINVLCRWCITTLISGFTSVVSSFTPVNFGNL